MPEELGNILNTPLQQYTGTPTATEDTPTATEDMPTPPTSPPLAASHPPTTSDSCSTGQTPRQRTHRGHWHQHTYMHTYTSEHTCTHTHTHTHTGPPLQSLVATVASRPGVPQRPVLRPWHPAAAHPMVFRHGPGQPTLMTVFWPTKQDPGSSLGPALRPLWARRPEEEEVCVCGSVHTYIPLLPRLMRANTSSTLLT